MPAADSHGADDHASVKAGLRSRMRAIRRAVGDVERRSEVIVDRLDEELALPPDATVMVYTVLAGEPDVTGFIERCRSRGCTVVVPEDEPDPSVLDAVVVPALALTPDGWRLGQGGGWYDRFLAHVRPDCVTVGVVFAEQVVAELPVEMHDIRLRGVVTDAPE